MNHARDLAARTRNISGLCIQTRGRNNDVLYRLALRSMACHGKPVFKLPKSPAVDQAPFGGPDPTRFDFLYGYDFSIEKSSASVVCSDEQPVAGCDLQFSGARDGIGATAKGQLAFTGFRLGENASVDDSRHLSKVAGFEPIRSPVESGDHSDLVVPRARVWAPVHF